MNKNTIIISLGGSVVMPDEIPQSFVQYSDVMLGAGRCNKIMRKKFSPEFRALEKVELDQAYEKAEEVLQEDAINMEDFKDFYNEEKIQKDREYIKEKEKIFFEELTEEEKEIRKIATIFEAIIHQEIELSDWLGESAFTIKSSRYDDIKNGIDVIIEFRDEEGISHLALAIDVTFGTKKETLDKKYSNIKKEIEDGTLSQLEYFKSQKKIPKVIIGTEIKQVKELITTWLNNNRNELAEHNIQFLILKEIQIQLETFKKYAEKIGQDEIVQIYQNSLDIIDEVMESKGNQALWEEIEDDNVFQALKVLLENF